MKSVKEEKKALREELKSQRDARWRCLNSRVQTFTKELSQQLTTEDINWYFISAWRRVARHGGEQLELHPSPLSSVSLPGDGCTLPSANCTLWALRHTFPPVLPALMARSTISWSAAFPARCWCIHTVSRAQSVSPRYWLAATCRFPNQLQGWQRVCRSPLHHLHLCLVVDAQRCTSGGSRVKALHWLLQFLFFFCKANLPQEDGSICYDPVRNQCLCVTPWYSTEGFEIPSLITSESLLKSAGFRWEQME